MDGSVNIIDVEATCWDGATPTGQTNEIIEIGVCVLHLETLERVEKRSLVVKPAHSEVSAFCTQLTGWTPEQVALGVPFSEAARILEKVFRSRSRTWLSWGDYDRKQFERECAAKGVSYPFSSRHVNAKAVFANGLSSGKKVGMSQALAWLNLPLEGRHHNGADDAWNIARIVTHMLESGVLTLPETDRFKTRPSTT
jgi:inhibitor of KinA sporulation pathway (predicted exonuclease)